MLRNLFHRAHLTNFQILLLQNFTTQSMPISRRVNTSALEDQQKLRLVHSVSCKINFYFSVCFYLFLEVDIANLHRSLWFLLNLHDKNLHQRSDIFYFLICFHRLHMLLSNRSTNSIRSKYLQIKTF